MVQGHAIDQGAEKYAGENANAAEGLDPFPSTILGVSTSRATSTEPAKVDPFPTVERSTPRGSSLSWLAMHEQQQQP